MAELPIPTVWASLGMKVNIGNYENQDINIGVSGIRVDATDEYIDAQMEKANLTLQKVCQKLAGEITRQLKENYGRG